jgi:hypothetical protein
MLAMAVLSPIHLKIAFESNQLTVLTTVFKIGSKPVLFNASSVQVSKVSRYS